MWNLLHRKETAIQAGKKEFEKSNLLKSALGNFYEQMESYHWSKNGKEMENSFMERKWWIIIGRKMVKRRISTWNNYMKRRRENQGHRVTKSLNKRREGRKWWKQRESFMEQREFHRKQLYGKKRERRTWRRKVIYSKRGWMNWERQKMVKIKRIG